MDNDFDIDVPDSALAPPPGPLSLDGDEELPQPAPLPTSENKRSYTLEEVAKMHRNGNRTTDHQFNPQEVKAEIVRQIQERVSRKS
jgi:hypothetical protein